MEREKELLVTNEEALAINKSFQIGQKSGTKSTVICVNEELEMIRRVPQLRTKKQVIDHMQKFVSSLYKRD